MCRITLDQADADRIGIQLQVVRNGSLEEIEKYSELLASAEEDYEKKSFGDKLHDLCSKTLIATLPGLARSITCKQLGGTLVLNAGADAKIIDHIESLENAYGISAHFDF